MAPSGDPRSKENEKVLFTTWTTERTPLLFVFKVKIPKPKFSKSAWKHSSSQLLRSDISGTEFFLVRKNLEFQSLVVW